MKRIAGEARPARGMIRDWTASLALCLAFSFLACPSIPRPADVASPSGKVVPYRLFEHDDHDDLLNSRGMTCGDCHVGDPEETGGTLSEKGRATCHLCHEKEATRTAHHLKCLYCHRDLQAIRPANHTAGWLKAHGAMGKTSGIDCANCHANRFCVACHSRRDEAKRVYHRGSVLATHSLDARTDPYACGRCHRYDYCRRCHTSGK